MSDDVEWQTQNGAGRKEGGGGNRPRIRIDLAEHPEKESAGDTYSLEAVALVKSGNGPVEDVDVQFLFNAKPYENPVRTKSAGRAEMKFQGLTKKLHHFGAEIVAGQTQNFGQPIPYDSVEEKRLIGEEPLGIKLEHGSPEKDGGKFKVTVTAFVSTKKTGVLKEGVKVNFDKNGVVLGSRDTNAEGKAIIEVADLEKGTYTIRGVIEGTVERHSVIIPITEETKKKAAKLIAHEGPTVGGYAVEFQVLTEDDSPVQGATVTISDALDPRGPQRTKPTEKDGTVCHVVSLGAPPRSRNLNCTVAGSVASCWLYLPKHALGGVTP